MEDVTQFYSKTTTFKESRFSQFLSSKDAVDSCVENGQVRMQSKCVSFESKTSLKYASEILESKSFIQQRVERLYGPGALAQGFFVTKRQKNRISESEDKLNFSEDDQHSKSMTDKFSEQETEPPSMKQSTSTPTLPVLRHLRPEFRAQLPIISPKKSELLQSLMQKSATIPKLKVEEVKTNGHSEIVEEDKEKANGHVKNGSNGHFEKRNGHVKGTTNGSMIDVENKNEKEVKDGHYFLKILEAQTKRLLALADRVEVEMSTLELSEENVGRLRSASGKARLLVSQKMQQFKGLCTNNINQGVGEAFPTTNEDLQGFWDMVMLQVDQVNMIFEEIDELRKNNWQEVPKEEIKKSVTNGTVKNKKVTIARPRPSSSQNDLVRKQREFERKKIIEERRKAMKAQQKQNENIEFFVNESS